MKNYIFGTIGVGLLALAIYGAIVGMPRAEYQTPVQAGNATSSLEALIEQETETQMQNPDFIAQERADARRDVIMAIYNKTTMEIVDGATAKTALK